MIMFQYLRVIEHRQFFYTRALSAMERARVGMVISMRTCIIRLSGVYFTRSDSILSRTARTRRLYLTMAVMANSRATIRQGTSRINANEPL